jgi:hypothetical protein
MLQSIRPSHGKRDRGCHECALCPSPQIFGGSPGSGSGSSISRSLICLGGGRNTVSRSFGLPFPLSLSASGVQHSEQMSYSLPSISFCKQFFVSPQRSQIIISFPLLQRIFAVSGLSQHSTLRARTEARLVPLRENLRDKCRNRPSGNWEELVRFAD